MALVAALFERCRLRAAGARSRYRRAGFVAGHTLHARLPNPTGAGCDRLVGSNLGAALRRVALGPTGHSRSHQCHYDGAAEKLVHVITRPGVIACPTADRDRGFRGALAAAEAWAIASEQACTEGVLQSPGRAARSRAARVSTVA